MAPVTHYEPLRNCLSASMWEKDGIQYRSNLLHRVGAKVALHAHSYDHTARIRGRLRMIVVTPDGAQQSNSEVATGESVFIPAWHRHSFELLEGVDGIGEVLCFWPVGADQ